MPRKHTLRPAGRRAAGFAIMISACAFGGCSPSPGESSVGNVRAPEGWQPVSVQEVRVPGTPLSAWKGPGGALMVIFRCLPTPGATSQQLAQEFTNRLENLPGAQLVRQSQVAGREDVRRVDAVAPGNGISWAPSGLGTPTGENLIPTHLTAVGRPTAAATYWLYVYRPENSPSDDSTIEEMIKSWNVDQ